MTMLKVVEKRNPNALAQLEALVDAIVADMAEEGAMVLYEALDESTSTRTGEHYAGQPRRSSKPHEMPQKQRSSGGLQDMVDYRQVGPGEHVFGLFPEGADEKAQAEALELGAPRAGVIARAPVRRIAFDSRTHRRMIDAAKRRRG
jgi:hypothetical protein